MKRLLILFYFFTLPAAAQSDGVVFATEEDIQAFDDMVGRNQQQGATAKNVDMKTQAILKEEATMLVQERKYRESKSGAREEQWYSKTGETRDRMRERESDRDRENRIRINGGKSTIKGN